jgi:hypothetical protein
MNFKGGLVTPAYSDYKAVLMLWVISVNAERKAKVGIAISSWMLFWQVVPSRTSS